jgi:phosphatidate cytidylyltransferase
MKRILTATVLIAVVFALIFFGNQLALIIFSALAALLAAYEYVALTRAGDEVVPAWWMLPAVAMLFAVTYFRPLDSPLAVLSALGLSLLTIVAFREANSGHLERVLPIAAAGFFGLIYIAYPLTLLPLLWARENGPTLLIFLMLVVWTGDIAALYIGKSFGRRKLAPALSPNKTREGAIASLLGSVVIAGLLAAVCEVLNRHGSTVLHISQPLWQTLLIAAVVNIAAQVGDLLESALKRGVGVKDSGAMLPGHGGILDRIDALLVAAPVLWYLLLMKEAAGLGTF